MANTKKSANKSAQSTNKKAATKAAEARTYITLTREEQLAMARDIAANVHTCKEASARFNALADTYGKDVAKAVLTAAKESIKASAAAVTADAKSVQDCLRDGERIAKAAWADILADESVQGRQWARFVYESAGCNLLAMAKRYADYVTADGELARKSTHKGADGERESGYVRMTNTPGAWLAVLKAAVKNAKKAALGASRSEYQRTVALTWE